MKEKLNECINKAKTHFKLKLTKVKDFTKNFTEDEIEQIATSFVINCIENNFEDCFADYWDSNVGEFTAVNLHEYIYCIDDVVKNTNADLFNKYVAWVKKDFAEYKVNSLSSIDAEMQMDLTADEFYKLRDSGELAKWYEEGVICDYMLEEIRSEYDFSDCSLNF